MSGKESSSCTKDNSDEPQSKKQKLDTVQINCENTNVECNKNSSSALPDCFQNNEKKCGIQYLDTPLKSQDDTKEYRSLKLQNGLTVLLISDSEQCLSKEAKTTICPKNSGNTLNASMSEYKPDNEYTALGSLCINVGSFSDPPHVQGLAHLLEHTISMGSKKYPKENDYSAFIEQRWGYCNAITDCEETFYSFQIREKYLLETLDRFASFFIDPLLTKDAISRECHSVENEFKLIQQSDDDRKNQLIFSFKKSDHPASFFLCGNNNTLQGNIDLDKLHSELHEFRKRHYSAHRMTLVIQASLSLNTLEDFVKQCFSDIPVNYLPPDDFSQYLGMDCFDNSKFGRIYYVKTLKDVLEIELNWALPPMRQLYKSKPWLYMDEFLCSSEEGSLFHYLEKKSWSSHSNCDEAFFHTSTYTLFSLRLNLTNEGYSHLNEVLKVIFSYINFIQRECTDQLVFDKFLELVEESYSYSTYTENPVDSDMENIVLNMQYYPPTYHLNGYDLVFEYDPKVVQRFINMLKPDNVNIIISSKQFEDKLLKDREIVFQTEYSSEEIPEELIKCCKIAEPLPEFRLNIKKAEALVEDYSNDKSGSTPVDLLQIDNDKNIDLWYKENLTYNTSQLSMCIHLKNPAMNESPTQIAAINVLTFIFNDTVKKYSISSAISFAFSFSGFLIVIPKATQTRLMGDIAQSLINLLFNDELITENIFESAKSEVLRRFYNVFINPQRLAREAWLSLILSEFWMANERYNALVGMTYDQFIDHVRNVKKKYFVQCLVEGNMENEDIIERVCQVVGPLLKNASATSENHKLKLLKFANGEKCCQIKNMNLSDAITVVNNFYQTDIASVKLLVICKLLTVIIHEPLFDCLRTQEQLGYHVEFSHSYVHGVIFLEVKVLTQADKFTGEHVNGRIQHFINNYAETLKNMTKQEFDLVKENYIKCQDMSAVSKDELLVQKTEVLGEPLTNIIEEEMKTLESVSLEEVHSAFVDYMVGGSGFKKISLQVVGTSDSSNIDDNMNAYEGGKYLLKYSTEIEENEKINSEYYINDINRYKSGLNAYE